MKSKLFNWGVTTKIILSILLICSLLGVFTFFIYKNIDKHIEERNESNTKTDKINNEVLNFAKINNELAMLVKDVSATNLLVQDYILEGDEIDIRDRNAKWDKSMMPKISHLEDVFEYGHTDELKGKFNGLISSIIEIKRGQEDILEEGGDIRENLLKLNKKFKVVSESYDDFTSTKRQNEISAYKLINVEYDSYYWVLFGLLIIVVVLILYYLIKSILYPMIYLERNIRSLNEGDIPSEIVIQSEDFKLSFRTLNHLYKMLKGIREFALGIGEGKFDKADASLFGGKGTLGEALSYMQESLKKVAKEDKQRNHINEGLAKFSEILGKNTNSLERFGDETILNLVQFLNANQGGIFVVNEDDSNHNYLELIASYAYNKKKYIDIKIKKGQGLVGQAWQEGKRIYMTDVPKNYVNITSGLGYSTPRCILIIPLIFNEKIHGVIEMASFHELEDYELGFIEKVSESISSALASVKVNTTTQRLLLQSEEITNKMKQQEEATQKNLLELTETQKESQKREEEHMREIKRLRKRLDEYEKNF